MQQIKYILLSVFFVSFSIDLLTPIINSMYWPLNPESTTDALLLGLMVVYFYLKS